MTEEKLTRIHQRLRARMLKPDTHEFLYSLYKRSPSANKRRIRKATSEELNVLLNILYCLERGHVKLRHADYDQLVKSRRLNLLLRHRRKYKSLKRAPQEEKKEFLTKFASLYAFLLRPLYSV